MDKARFAGRSALEYFGLSSSKEISIDEAANKLVKELTGEDPVSRENSYETDVQVPEHVSKGAMTALLSIHGGEQKDQNAEEDVSEKINDARKKYLKRAGTADKAKLAAEFDDKVINLLVQRLSVRGRLFYCGKAEALSLARQQGTATKHELNQEMDSFLGEIMNPKIFTLEVEVTNALSLIGNESGDVLDGLFCLFKGEVNGNLVKKMHAFDTILPEILDSKDFGQPEDEKKRNYQRSFIAKAREKLASRLPEPTREEYFRVEQERQKELSQGRINYDNYRNSMKQWLAARPLEEGLKKAFDGKDIAERGEILVNLIKEKGFYDNRHHMNYVGSESKGKVQGVYLKFLGAAHAYVDSKPSIPKTSQEKYSIFLNEAKKQLLQGLPESISKAHKEHVKILDELRQRGYINPERYRESMDAYLLELIDTVKDDKNSNLHAARNTFEKLGSSRPHLEKIVTDALKKSIRTNNKIDDILEALVMCWGGKVNSRRNDFSLGPVCVAKSNYLKAENSMFADDQIMNFRVDGDFSIEARKQLVKQLPGNLRQSYEKHEKLLLDHLGKGHITQETYWDGMLLFLGKYFQFKN